MSDWVHYKRTKGAVKLHLVLITKGICLVLRDCLEENLTCP